MNVQGSWPFGIVVCLITSLGALGPSEVRAQNVVKAKDLIGAWTLNKELSDRPQNDAPPEDSGRGDPGRRGGGGGPGRGRGGFGGGGRDDGFGGPSAPPSAEANARRRDAMRDITNPPNHLTIVATETMIILTGPDGRTTRLSPDGKKIKDENTGIERRTKWDGARLVVEISGLGPGKATETYSVDVERRQLRRVAEMEAGSGNVRKFSHVYDLDPQ